MNSLPNTEREAALRTRRAFLTMGVGAAVGYGGWSWLRSRPEEGDVEWPLRRVLRGNETIAEAYFKDSHRSPEFGPSQVTAPRQNGEIGLGADFEPDRWVLSVHGFDSTPTVQVTMARIRELPRVEQITQLNCIEGWTTVVRWAGARFADFTAKYAPRFHDARYVGMQTPDRAYFVGLDSASALHPQTLLCYEMNGADLTSEHGAPLRLVIPVKYGVKNIKRIGTIIYTNERPEDYWANQGYDWYAGL
ncbi:MAG TPA: molybdopterin-dependent oxidoreductase [Bryobacteraceae bacterium]|nr:molybdopterin-dependent oxidoreductase [Bryobacteraceae bacterium]